MTRPTPPNRTRARKTTRTQKHPPARMHRLTPTLSPNQNSTEQSKQTASASRARAGMHPPTPPTRNNSPPTVHPKNKAKRTKTPGRIFMSYQKYPAGRSKGEVIIYQVNLPVLLRRWLLSILKTKKCETCHTFVVQLTCNKWINPRGHWATIAIYVNLSKLFLILPNLWWLHPTIIVFNSF